MLLVELFDQHRIEDPVAYGRHVIRRLEQAGADNDKENAEMMYDLRHAVDELEAATFEPHNHQHKIDGGRHTSMQSLQKRVYREIEEIEYKIKASAGAGGLAKTQRATMDRKQRQDPLSRRIRDMRKKLKDNDGFDTLDESASKGSTNSDKIAR